MSQPAPAVRHQAYLPSGAVVTDQPAPGATPLYRLASAAVGQDAHTWAVARRADGHSYRGIAGLLADATDGQVVVSHQTIYRWANRRQ